MINAFSVIQTKAFARQDGAILGLVWTVSFLCSMMSSRQAGAAFIGNLLCLMTPFVVVWRLRIFRDKVLDGRISFRKAFAYCALTFFYATLLLTIVQFVWFKYFDHGQFLATQVIPSYKAMGQTYQLADAQIQQMIDVVSYFTPVAWASFFMLFELSAGIIASLIIAAVMKQTVNVKR